MSLRGARAKQACLPVSETMTYFTDKPVFLRIDRTAAFVTPAAAGGLSLPYIPDKVEADKAQYAEHYYRHDDRRKICPNKIHVSPL
jgi:hypothetical protein